MEIIVEYPVQYADYNVKLRACDQHKKIDTEKKFGPIRYVLMRQKLMVA